MKILFCGRDMHYGFVYTKQEVEARGLGTVVQCDRQDIKNEIIDADVIVPLMSALSADVLEACQRAKLIIQYGAGVEGIDIPAATKKGIYVSNIPSKDTGNAESCAEMCIFLILAMLRKVNLMAESIQHQRLGVPIGSMLKGKSICIIGFGNIAKCLVPRLKAFNVSISVLRRDIAAWDGKDVEWTHNLDDFGSIGRQMDMERILRVSDIIVFTCSLNKDTANMMNGDFLKLCRFGVVIVNVARGGLLCKETVFHGLQTNNIGGLGLDVQFYEPFDPEDPIARHPNVYLTPHVAGVTETSYRSMAAIVASEAEKVVLHSQKPSITLNKFD